MNQLSFYTSEANLTRGHGYADAAFNMVTSMQNNGYRVLYNSPEPPIQIHFSQPSYFADMLRSEQYKIALTPWESTMIPRDWVDVLQECDELWATSTWCKNMYEDLGFKVSHVYPHGIAAEWTPKKKKPGKVLKFLHVGEPAPRKGGQEAYEAFKKAFGNQDDVKLYLKTRDHSHVRNKRNGSIVGELEKNVVVFSADLDEPSLINLYQQCDFLVYPSYGEGFGLIPLQGLATGTPTICTGEWAEYKNFLGELSLDSTLIKSPWPEMHPGNVLKPDQNQLVEKLRYCYNNVDELHNKFYKQAFQVHSAFDWDKLTGQALEKLNITV